MKLRLYKEPNNNPEPEGFLKLKKTPAPKFYWHIHHDILVELATEPIESRIAFIKAHKPKNEQALRLRLLKPVKGALPQAVVKAGAELDKSDAEYRKSDAGCRKAYAAYCKSYAEWGKALIANMPAIEALHAKECPNCPWDGKTIFPKQTGKDGR